jgi:hypothetical protein
LLWADIKQLFAYGWKHEVEKQGVLARLSRHLRLWPQAWAISARQILTQTGRDSTEVIDLLAMAAAEHDSVHAALEQVTSEDVTSEVAAASDHEQVAVIGLLAHHVHWGDPVRHGALALRPRARPGRYEATILHCGY